MQNRASFLSVSCILGLLVWLCLQEFLSLTVEQLFPKSYDLVPSIMVVKWSVIYSLLINSEERVWELGKEIWILHTLGMVFTCCIFPCSIWRHTLCFLPLCLYTCYFSKQNTVSFPFHLTSFSYDSLIYLRTCQLFL